MKKIICPNCGYEYLPVEIFIPKCFMGDVKYIERDPNGKILSYGGKKMDLNETYKCDGCNTRFKVYCDVKFHCTSDAMNFRDTYVTKIKKPSLFMSED